MQQAPLVLQGNTPANVKSLTVNNTKTCDKQNTTSDGATVTINLPPRVYTIVTNYMPQTYTTLKATPTKELTKTNSTKLMFKYGRKPKNSKSSVKTKNHVPEGNHTKIRDIHHVPIFW